MHKDYDFISGIRFYKQRKNDRQADVSLQHILNGSKLLLAVYPFCADPLL